MNMYLFTFVLISHQSVIEHHIIYTYILLQSVYNTNTVETDVFRNNSHQLA